MEVGTHITLTAIARDGRTAMTAPFKYLEEQPVDPAKFYPHFRVTSYPDQSVKIFVKSASAQIGSADGSRIDLVRVDEDSFESDFVDVKFIQKFPVVTIYAVADDGRTGDTGPWAWGSGKNPANTQRVNVLAAR